MRIAQANSFKNNKTLRNQLRLLRTQQISMKLEFEGFQTQGQGYSMRQGVPEIGGRNHGRVPERFGAKIGDIKYTIPRTQSDTNVTIRGVHTIKKGADIVRHQPMNYLVHQNTLKVPAPALYRKPTQPRTVRGGMCSSLRKSKINRMHILTSRCSLMFKSMDKL